MNKGKKRRKKQSKTTKRTSVFLISNFHRVLNVVFFLLGDFWSRNSDAGESPKRKNTTISILTAELGMKFIICEETLHGEWWQIFTLLCLHYVVLQQMGFLVGNGKSQFISYRNSI